MVIADDYEVNTMIRFTTLHSFRVQENIAHFDNMVSAGHMVHSESTWF